MIRRLLAPATLTLLLLACIAIVPDSNADAPSDTDIDECTDNASTQPCLVARFSHQDAKLGHDVAARVGKSKKIGNGRSGFNYSRLNGGDCVRDNVTGLVWENKTDDGGLRDADNTYTWYNPNTNGGYAGHQNGGYCAGSRCDTDAYARAINEKALCGFTDWHLPTKKELISLVNRNIPYPGPTINSDYFPNTRPTWFWSATPFAYNPDYTWVVFFYDGNYGVDKYDDHAVRLVRGGQ